MTKSQLPKNWKYVTFNKEEVDRGEGSIFEAEAESYFLIWRAKTKAILIRRSAGNMTYYYCSSSWQYPSLPKGKRWKQGQLATREGIQVIYPAKYDLDEWLAEVR